MGISKITRNFQITIPHDVRATNKLHVGDRVLFVMSPTTEKVEIVKMDKSIIQETAGLWKDMKETGLEYERRLRKEWEKRIK